jgi:hypothetical protein
VVPINRNGEMYRGTARAGVDVISKYDFAAYYYTKSNATLNVDSGRYADFFMMYLADGYGIVDARTDPMQTEAEYHGYPVGGTGYPENRYWKIYGDLKGALGASSYEVTLPVIANAGTLQTIGSIKAYVPDPYQGNSGNLGSGSSQLEWEITDAIIGTDPGEGAVTTVFDYQNFDFNWFNIGIQFAAGDSHLYLWD